MVFNSIFFIFVFLPVSLLLYYVTPTRGKNLILALTGLVFYSWGTPEYIVLMLFSILFNYLAGLDIGRSKEKSQSRRAQVMLIASVAVNLLLLGFFKYWEFLLNNINGLLHTSFKSAELPMPIGISFYTFTILSYLFDVYHEKVSAQKNLIDLSAYVTFFPKLISGPIVEYNQMEPQLKKRHVDIVKFGEGARLLILGLGKKVILADNLNAAFIAVTGLDSVSVLSAWLGCILYTLLIYMDFSSYSDMAIGIAKMFGFEIEKNFDYPYCSKSITEFWRRWHISLGRWFRDYVYIPLGGNRCSTLTNIRNILIVWFLTGFWHGAAWNFIFWGLYYGALLLIEKFLMKDILSHIPSAVQHVFSVFLVMIGWVFFFSPSLSFAFSWIGMMFGIGAAGTVDTAALYYLAGNGLLMLISAIGCTPVAAKIGRRVLNIGKGGTIAGVLCSAAILLCSIAYMINATYSSFLYFKF